MLIDTEFKISTLHSTRLWNCWTALLEGYQEHFIRFILWKTSMHPCPFNGSNNTEANVRYKVAKLWWCFLHVFIGQVKSAENDLESIKSMTEVFSTLVTNQSFVLFSLISKAEGRKLKMNFRVNLHVYSVPCIVYLMCLWCLPFFSLLQWHSIEAIKHVLEDLRLYARNNLFYVNWFDHATK